MSARRLRGAQPPGSALEHASSSSSLNSNKNDKAIKENLRRETPTHKPRDPSTSSDDNAQDPPPPERGTRQTRQQQKRELSSLDGANDNAVADDDDDDEDADGEVTRCICGQAEYPGPPVPLRQDSRNGGSRESGRLASLAAAEGLPEDAGGLFIQCDRCHVWQHGGCVGIMQEDHSPDNYYCERCRKDLHRLLIGARGERYSRYIPVLDLLRSTPVKPRRISGRRDSDSQSSREVDSKSGALLSSAKRRSTLNSRRDLEEEEQLRKAIEESKGEGGSGSNGNGNRRSKRGREEDTDESREPIKRRKTGSGSTTPPPSRPAPQEEASEDEDQGGRSRSNTNGRRAKNGPVNVQKERELREKVKEREAERVEAAGRRKGRADRRRADEPEPHEEPARPSTARNPSSKTTRPPLVTKQSSQQVPTTSVSHKKKPAAKKGRVGRNQYTKDRDQANDRKESPKPPNSRGSEEAGPAETNGVTPFGNGSKPSKPRHMNPNRTSMNDLRKRAAGILEYITRTQVEMAGHSTPSKEGSGVSSPTSKAINGTNILSRLGSEIAGPSEEELKRRDSGGSVDEGMFKNLNSLEMMDVLTRELVLWQKDFGKYGEKA